MDHYPLRRIATITTKQQQRINEQIRVSQVRVIGVDGAQLGILATEEALATARSAGLDLVEVAPDSKPPVCRVMDYGKFKYQQKKRQHKSHTHQHKVKEIRVRPKTGDHDINVKVNRARTFLEHKDKVLISVMFRGREITHIDEGHRVITQMLEQLEDVSKVEIGPLSAGEADHLHPGAEIGRPLPSVGTYRIVQCRGQS